MFGQVTIVTLPSGDKVRCKKPSLVTMLTVGLFPNDLTVHAIRLYNKDLPAVPTIEDPEQVKAMMRLIDAFIPRVLVDPAVGAATAVTLDPDGIQTGTTTLEDIPDADKQWLFLWGQSLLPDDATKLPAPAEETPPASAAVAPFRAGDERPDAGSLGATVPPAAVEPAGDPAGAPVRA